MGRTPDILSTDAPDATRLALEALARGELVALPTETVYGLAADARNDRAVAQIYAAKGRPGFNPLIAHVDGCDMAERLVELSPLAMRLVEAFWPGPLTIVAPRRADAGVSPIAAAGLDTLAVRAPAHETTRGVISAFGAPLVAPSANPSGRLSPTCARHVVDGFQGRDGPTLVLDAGPSSVGVESTIVLVNGDDAVLLRPGGLSREVIEGVLGRSLPARRDGAVIDAPGQLASHYAPAARLRLEATAPRDDEAFLAFGETPQRRFQENLSLSRDLNEAAANLFEMLWRLDALVAANGLAGIAVAPVPATGLGLAINDRLARAAAPRTL
ncbi:MAG: threonylcarbamoyl-AMP synthase [Alphaproteobacteria bacterium]|nr:threonylcarbamoyl-AMP synthase [Alphaproteobacteria bacterium]